jgi:DNA topoisomerase-1
MDVVVVESPAKAKTIEKYLGPGYTVLASYGHVRDLPPKDGSVRPDEDFAMSWQVDGKSEKRLSDIARAAKSADSIILATDPDREGEAISWHVAEELKKRGVLDGAELKRVVFNEITKRAVQDAMAHPRDIDHELVDAYMARRALDYLVGFTLSPILWRKLPGSRSAGRVQSVALRLICEREAEIEVFRPREYWSVEADMKTPAGVPFVARLTGLDGTKLDRFDLGDETAAQAAATRVRQGDFGVTKVERKEVRRRAQPPFTTSTLQQEASRKLGFSARQTMSVAQRLYEGIDIGGETVGLITYMRTDGLQLAQEAVGAVRGLIGRSYGDQYVPEKPVFYKSRSKNAQEAHEAIRPTDVTRRPDDVARHLDRDQQRLYELIWKRMVACQMAPAVFDQVAVDMTAENGNVALRANGSVLKFDGFLKVYQEGRDDNGAGDDDRDNRLPALNEGDAIAVAEVRPEQHFTEPPPRYSEASLVKKLEELGIGRPSTYASIISVLQDRNYVRLDSKRFVPEDRGRLVSAFLESFFHRYVEYDFTAELENRLDEISAGDIDWKKVLRDFWQDFSGAVDETKELRIAEVLDALNETLGPHFFPDTGNGKDPRACPACEDGRLSLKVGKFGAFIGCSNYPECRYTRQLAVPGDNPEAEIAADGPKELGTDPGTGRQVTLRKGPYGHYVQLGEPENGSKPKRTSIPKGTDVEAVDLDLALGLLSLPREIGDDPESGEKILAGIGRYGPYVKRGSTFKSIPAGEDVLTIGINRAVDLLAQAGKGGRRGATPLRVLGEHPEGGGEVAVFDGRYGPYVKHGKINATLPKDKSPDEVTLDEAVTLIAERAARTGKKTATKKKKSAKKKTAAKKKSAAKRKSAPGTSVPESGTDDASA